jgi:ribosomal protein S18 acetylase RimI-like enzyme
MNFNKVTLEVYFYEEMKQELLTPEEALEIYQYAEKNGFRKQWHQDMGLRHTRFYESYTRHLIKPNLSTVDVFKESHIGSYYVETEEDYKSCVAIDWDAFDDEADVMYVVTDNAGINIKESYLLKKTSNFGDVAQFFTQAETLSAARTQNEWWRQLKFDELYNTSFSESCTEMKLRNMRINGHTAIILPLDNKTIREPYFSSWLYNLARHDLNNAAKDDYFFNSITPNPTHGIYVYGYNIDGKTEGVIQVVDEDDYAKIYWFFVNLRKHNQGIGQALFDFVMNKFGDKTLELDTKASNDKALYIYKKYGFKVTNEFNRTINGVSTRICSMKREPRLFENIGSIFMDCLFNDDDVFIRGCS